MPLISIPSSIAGINVPGTTSNGPLGLLFNNPFSTNILHYPRDLNSMTKGHSIYFTIYKVKPVGYEDVKQLGINVKSFFTEGTDTSLSSIANKIISGVSTEANNIKNSTGLNFQPERKTPSEYISLYMPDTLDFTYGVSYDDTVSAVSAVGSTIGAALNKIIPGSTGGVMSDAITSAISASGPLAQLGLQKAGYAINPQLQVLFQGIHFRDFSMSFTFTPYSQDEAKMVENIIKTFRKHAAPQIVQGTGGMFFVPPSSFGLEFRFNGQKNPHLNKIKDCVITNIDVNYAPNGWSAHDDGAPIQTTMNLSFKELSLIDSTEIERGY
jgi:hypothetical protein